MRIDITKHLDKINLSDPIHHFVHAPENVLYITMTVNDAIESLWRRPYNPHIGYFYVIDHHNVLCGVISSHKLLHGEKGEKIEHLMEKQVIKLKEKHSIAEALTTLAEEHLSIVPIINEDGVLSGVIELITEIDPPAFEKLTHSRMRKKAKTDLYKVLGLSIEQHRKSIFQEYSTRMPWILGNIGAGLICAGILFFYEHVIAGTFILAMFIPLVLTLCESIAMQATLNTTRYLGGSKIPWNILFQRGSKELQLALLIAATAAACAAAVAMLIENQILPMVVIAISIFISMIVASSLGMIITVLAHKFGMDPKFASGPMVLMFTDVTATAAYFTIAYLLLT